MSEVNDYLILISGGSATGKSAALKELPQQEGVLYLNCEAGKKLPFRNKFREYKITDPLQVLEAFDAVESEKLPNIHTVIVDSLTFLLDMYESLYIVGAANGQQAWGNFQQYFKTLMQDRVTKCKANVIFTAHTLQSLNEGEMTMETKVPVKGALKNNGIEAYFSCVVSTKRVTTKRLEDYKEGNDLLHISEEEEALGFKYVFQTKLTKDTIHERIRSPMGLFTNAQTFIDNDVNQLLRHLHCYYNS